MALLAALAGSALALAPSASAIDLGPGDLSPVVQYEPTTQTSFVAWTENEHKSIELCVLPAGATGCEGGAPLLMKDTRAEVGASYNGYGSSQLVVEPDGGVVLVADLDPVSPAVTPSGWSSRGVVAWSSAAGGAGFFQSGQGLADNGELLAPERAYTPQQGAVALGASPTQVGVFGEAYPFGNGFAAFGMSKPFATNESESPEPNTTGLFEENLDVDGTQMAAQLNTPAPGDDLVVTVGSNYSSANSECPGNEHSSGFGFADTTFANLNKQASWEVGGTKYKTIACDAEAAVVAGGPSGIGVFEDEGPGLETGGEDTVAYRSFDASTHTFNAPVIVSQEAEHTLLGADGLSLSQDSSGGVYAMWSDSRGKELSYSSNGGTSWGAPVTALPEEADGPVVAGVGGGTADAAYNAAVGGAQDVFFDEFNYGELAEQPTAIATTLSGAGQIGDNITVPDGTAVTDTASLSGTNAGEATGAAGYAVYSNSNCSILAAAAGAGAFSGGTAAASTPESLAPGTYYWAASYAGDANNRGSSTACGSEIMHVLAPTSTSTEQTGAGVSGASLTVPGGSSVTDSAHVAGEFASIATGSVSYQLYKNRTCTVRYGSASVRSVSAGNAAPSAAEKPPIGTYFWRASYSGDGANEASVSPCGGEVLVVATQVSTLGLPSAHLCLSKRAFTIHPHAPAGVKLVSVEILINGKLDKRGKLSRNATFLSLVGLPKGTFVVSLVAKSSKGRTYVDVRTFHTCVPKKKSKK